MKAAFLGTDHYQHDTNPQTILREAGVQCMQRMAGYIPARLPDAMPFLPPVHQTFMPFVPHLIRELAHNKTRLDGNPRMPYLTLAWLLIGQDYPYHVLQFAEDKALIVQVAGLLLGIALGDCPDKARTSAIHTAAQTYMEIDNKHFHSLRPKQQRLRPMEQKRRAAVHIMLVYAVNIVHNLDTTYVYLILNMVTRLGDSGCRMLHAQAKIWRTMNDEQAWQTANRLMLDLLKIDVSFR
jgi:hypothetical protein